jgi:hypothetical protein
MSWASVVGAGIGLIGSSMNDGNSQTVQNSVPPEFSGLASQVGQMGQGFADLPYNPYPYSQVADFNPYQYMGFDMTADRAFGSALPQQAEGTLQNTLAGGYMQPTGFNPYADQQNPYAGQNPYLESVIGNTLGDVTKQFNTTVAPNMATTAMKSGSFGNSGFQEAEQNQRDALAKQLGNISSGMRMQDYGMQQGLAESGLNRNANLYEQMFGRQQGAYDAERNRMMGALGMSPSIYGLGYAPAQQLQGIGSTMQQQGQNQLNAQYGQFQEAQNWPFKIYDTMRAPFGGINPGGTQTTTGPAGNPVAGMVGGAMVGRQMAPMFGGLFGGQQNQGFGTGNMFGNQDYGQYF